MPKREQQELLANLEGVKGKISTMAAVEKAQNDVSRLKEEENLVVNPLEPPRSASPRSNASSSGRSTPPRSSKKRAAPKPPSAAPAIKADVHAEPLKANILPRKSSTSSGTSSRRASAALASAMPDPSKEQLRSHARDLVELVRVETGLSHSNSQNVVKSVLGYAVSHLPRLDRNLPAMLDELERPVLADKVDVAASADTKAMERLLNELTAAKEDDQQRNWKLHEDQHVIGDQLGQLSSSLQNSDPRCDIV